MCTRLRNTITHEEATNPPALRKMLNVQELVKEECYSVIHDDACLCQVDVKATVEAAGWKYHEVDGDYMDVEVTPPDWHSSQFNQPKLY